MRVLTGPDDPDEALVRCLLREQHPDLAGFDLARVAGGLDNRIWRLGAELAVRLPRTPRAPALLRNEQQWLPRLAPLLPLPIPIPVRIGEPSRRFPYPWTIVAWVHGETADRTPISRADHAAESLGGFLGALHRKADPSAPARPRRGGPLRTLTREFDSIFPRVASTATASEVRAVWNDAVAAPTWAGPRMWLHGDLHPANVVVSAGTLSGVIDFGELCAGDPATDLAAAWLVLPIDGIDPFFDTYAIADHATVRRARGWALLMGVSLIDTGHAEGRGSRGGRPTRTLAGRAAVDRVLASC